MTRQSASTGVVDLQSHPTWRAAHPRAAEMEEAMRRHPSFQSRSESAAPHLRLV
jgi:hypothetical protein